MYGGHGARLALTPPFNVYTLNPGWRSTYDPAKRVWTLRARGPDFEDVFGGRTYQRQVDRRDYGDVRIITIGLLWQRMVVVVWTPRGVDAT